jgi:hypothetical protein
MIWYDMIWYDVLCYDMIYDMVWYDVWCDMVWYDIIWCGMMRYMIRYDTVRYGTVRYDTIRYDTIRYDTVRQGTIRCDTVRYDTMRYTIYDMICIYLQLSWHPVAVVTNTFKHKQYTEKPSRQKQYIEQHNSLIRKSVDRAKSLWGLPWHLPYNWGKSREKKPSQCLFTASV